MLRKCDGTDDTLTRKLDDGRYVPCDCGKEFDDVNHLVIYPHEWFPDRRLRGESRD